MGRNPICVSIFWFCAVHLTPGYCGNALSFLNTYQMGNKVLLPTFHYNFGQLANKVPHSVSVWHCLNPARLNQEDNRVRNGRGFVFMSRNMKRHYAGVMDWSPVIAFIKVWMHVVFPAPLGPRAIIPWRTLCVSNNWMTFSFQGGWLINPTSAAFDEKSSWFASISQYRVRIYSYIGWRVIPEDL